MPIKQELIRRGETQGTPIIDRNQVTFIWYGRRPPELVGDFNDWNEQRPVRMKHSASQVWSVQLSFPMDAYVEYQYLLNGQEILDPHNPRHVIGGTGHFNNYFYMPESRPTPLIQRDRQAPRGEVTRFSVDTEEYVAGRQRIVYLYQPPVREPSPLLVVLDGQDYLKHSHLAVMVDNLIAQNRIQPVSMALVKNRSRARVVEYACSEATLAFLAEQVLSLAKENLNLVDINRHPGSYGILGASMGGLMALFSALRLPSIFGRVLSQSGSFDFFGKESLVFDLIRLSPTLPIRLWMDVGTMEDLLATNRRMRDLLLSKGYPVDYTEYNGGHNYNAWQNDIWRGLEALFGS